MLDAKFLDVQPISLLAVRDVFPQTLDTIGAEVEFSGCCSLDGAH